MQNFLDVMLLTGAGVISTQTPPVGPTTWVECLLLAPNLGRTGNAIG